MAECTQDTWSRLLYRCLTETCCILLWNELCSLYTKTNMRYDFKGRYAIEVVEERGTLAVKHALPLCSKLVVISFKLKVTSSFTQTYTCTIISLSYDTQFVPTI